MDSSTSVSPSVNKRMTSEEMLARSSNWTLGCDNALLNRLKDFSDHLASQAQHISKECESLGTDVSLLHSQVHNVTNQFLMLSNTHFVENRVEEFEETMSVGSASQEAPPKTKAEKEAELISKMKEAIQIGVGAKAVMQKTVGESKSANSLKLPFIIASSKFFSSRSCGLVDEANPFVQTNESTINSVNDSHEIRSTDSSSSTNNFKSDSGNNSVPSSQPPAFVRELYRPPSLNNSLDQEGSVSSDDLFSSNHIGRPASDTSSNSNIAHSHIDSQKVPPHSSSMPPIINMPKSNVDVNDLNNAIRARVPPPPVDSDESDYDFKPPEPGQGFPRKVFADVDDDDDDDLFGSNSIFASRLNQEIDNDDSFFDNPPPMKPPSIFGQQNPHPPVPAMHQTTPPPPVMSSKRNGSSNSASGKLAKQLFPDSPSTDEDEDIFAPPSKMKQPAGVSKPESSQEPPPPGPAPAATVVHPASEPSVDIEPESHQPPKLPYGAVSMFGNRPPPVIPTIKPKSDITNSQNTSTPAVPAETDGLLSKPKPTVPIFKDDNVKPVQDVVKSHVPSPIQKDTRKPVKPKSIFDDDSDDDLFSSVKNVSANKNKVLAKIGSSLFDDSPEYESTLPKASHSSKIFENSSESNGVDVQKEPEQKPKLRYGAVSMFGNLPPPVIPVRNETPGLLLTNEKNTIGPTGAEVRTAASLPNPEIAVSRSNPETTPVSTKNVDPPSRSTHATPATVTPVPVSENSFSEAVSSTTTVSASQTASIGTASTTKNLSSAAQLPISEGVQKSVDVKHVAAAVVAEPPPARTTPFPAIVDTPNPKTEQTQKPYLTFGDEPPPILQSSSSAESIASRNSRYSKGRSIFDDDSDDDLFSSKKSSKAINSKKVFPIKESKSLFDDISPPPVPKSTPLFAPDFAFDKQSRAPPITAERDHVDSEDEEPAQAKSKPKLPYGAVSMFGGMPPPVFPTRKSALSAQENTVTDKSTEPDLTVGSRVLSQEEPHHQVQDKVVSSATTIQKKPENVEPIIPKEVVQAAASVPIKKIEKKSSIFDNDSSDEDLFSTKKPPTKTTHNAVKKVGPLFDEPKPAVIQPNSVVQIPHLKAEQTRIQSALPISQPVVASESNSRPSPTIKTKQQRSIFSESDSDGDIFASASTSTKQQRSKTKLSGTKVSHSTHKPSSKSKVTSIFGDDSDEDIFTTSKSKPKVNQTLSEDQSVPNGRFSGVAAQHEPAQDISVTINQGRSEIRDYEGIDDDDATDLHNRSDSSTANHFVDLSTDPPNLLTSIAKNRPRIGNRRLPSRARKHKSAHPVSTNKDNFENSLSALETSNELTFHRDHLSLDSQNDDDADDSIDFSTQG